MKLYAVLFCAIQCFLLCASSLYAGGTGEGAENKGRIPRDFSVDLSVEHVGRAAVGALGGSASYTEYAAGFSWFFLFLGMEHREYDWRGDSPDLNGGFHPPWDSLTGLTSGLSYYRAVGDGSGVIANLFATYGFEEDSSSGTVSYNPQIFGFWAYGSRVTFFAGAGMRRHSVYSSVYPMLGVSWERDAVSSFYGFLGNPAVIGYRFNERTALNLKLGPDNRVYRLSGDNVFSPDGYLRTRDWKIGVSMEKSITENLMLSVGFNRYIERLIAIHDSGRNWIHSEDPESAFAVFADISYIF